MPVFPGRWKLKHDGKEVQSCTPTEPSCELFKIHHGTASSFFSVR